MRRLLRAGLGLVALATFLASGWALWQSPFSAPYRDRNVAELRVALDKALSREATPEVIAARTDAALDAGEVDEAAAVLRLADLRGVAMTAELRARVETAQDETQGWSACLACAFTPAACPDLTRVATCNLPLELTPVGDAKAIYRGLAAYVAGNEIDRIDLSLGIVGLTATAAVLTSGGTSLTVKAGATALRVARRTGAITGGLMDEIAGLAADALRMDRASDVLRGHRGPEALIDTTAATRLSTIAADMGRLTDVMPTGDALAVLRYAGNSGELARVARVANVAGPETRGTFAVLGKARVIRATQRLTELVLATIALLTALAGQLLAFVLWRLRQALRGGQGRTARPRSS